MALLVVSMQIIFKNELQMYFIMGSGYVDTLHDHMYVHHTLIQWHIHNSSKIIITCNSLKFQTWLIMDVWMVRINYGTKYPFKT
jgi:hypothetical protein